MSKKLRKAGTSPSRTASAAAPPPSCGSSSSAGTHSDSVSFRPSTALEVGELRLQTFVLTDLCVRAASQSTAGQGHRGKGRTMPVYRWEDNKGTETH